LLPCEYARHSSWSRANPAIETFAQIFCLEMSQTNPGSLVDGKMRSNISPDSVDPLIAKAFYNTGLSAPQGFYDLESLVFMHSKPGRSVHL